MAVAAYVMNLQQTASFLQRQLHESNFNADAWTQIQRCLQEHVTLTQNLARLPAPAMNRGEPASVSVVATSIPIPVGLVRRGDGQISGSMSSQQIRDMIQQQLRGLQPGNRGNGNAGSGSNGSSNNSSNGSNNNPSDDYSGMYL